MKIVLSPSVSMNLEAIVHQVGKQEFSGIGFCQVIDGDIYCYQTLLLDVGSVGYSEIPSKRLKKAMENRPDRDNARLWFHRHPIEGWSATDTETIEQAPLGGIPELVRWSASIVRTPTRWIGRIDNHIRKTHMEVEVEPNIDPDLMARAGSLLAEHWKSVGRMRPLDEHADLPDLAIFQAGFGEMPELFNMCNMPGLSDQREIQESPGVSKESALVQNPEMEREP